MAGFAENINCELYRTCTNIKGIVGSTVIRCHHMRPGECLELHVWKKKYSMPSPDPDRMCSLYKNIHVVSWTAFFPKVWTTCSEMFQLWQIYDRHSAIKWSMLTSWECKIAADYYFSPHCHNYYTQTREQGSTVARQPSPAGNSSGKPLPVVSIPHHSTQRAHGGK